MLSPAVPELPGTFIDSVPQSSMLLVIIINLTSIDFQMTEVEPGIELNCLFCVSLFNRFDDHGTSWQMAGTYFQSDSNRFAVWSETRFTAGSRTRTEPSSSVHLK